MPQLLDAVAEAVARIMDEQLRAVLDRLARVSADLETERAARAAMVEGQAALCARIARAEADIVVREAGLEAVARRLDKAADGVAELRGRAEMLARMPGPAGPMGDAGPAGRDGTLEAPELRCEPTDNPRRFVLVLRAASGVEARADFTVPAPLYQGVWQAGIDYQRGDCVTLDGSVWIAMADAATTRPGTEQGRAAWRLAVKRGRDAREAA